MKKSVTFLFIMQFFMIGSTTLSQPWQLQNSGTTLSLNNISFANAQHGYCVGDGGILLERSTVGGVWNPYNLGNQDLRGVCTPHDLDRERAFICSDDGSIYYKQGSEIWTEQVSGVTAALNDIKFLNNENTGVAVGADGTIVHTHDNGETWTKFTNLPILVESANFTKIDMFSTTEWRIVGEFGIVLRTNNGGETWYEEVIDGSPDLNCVKYTGSGEGWISGTSYNVEELYKFNGNVYTPYSLYPPIGITGLVFPTPDLGFGTGGNGYIINYNGTTWSKQQGPNTQQLKAVDAYVINYYKSAFEVYAWACGANGTIISTVQSFSKLEGNVTRNGTGIPDATVTATTNDRGPYSTKTDADGHFQIEPASGGTYTVTVTAVGYNTYSATGVVVSPPATATLNVTLTAPAMNITPAALAVNLMPGQATDCTLTIQNTGDGLLEWGSIPWNVLFNFNCNYAAQAGVETDGQFLYTSSFRSGGVGLWFHKYTLNGAWIEDFNIAGATKICDLAYDGAYFYGSDYTSTIYKMDFTNKVLVGTISTGVSAIRHIAWDSTNDGFWVGTWGTLYMVDRTGTTIATGSPGLTNMNGSAYDPWSAGGPYLWIFNQGGNKVDIWQYSIDAGALTGVKQDASEIPGYVGGMFGSSAGGLCISTQVVPGKIALIGSMQQIVNPNTIFGYNLGESTAPWKTHDPAFGTLAAGSTREVNVRLDATGLAAGSYTATLTFISKPNVGTVVIPVTLIIGSVSSTTTVTGAVTATTCYNATETISVAGNGTSFIVNTGGIATMIAGQVIHYFAGTKVEPGGYMWGYISPGGPWCLTPSMPAVVAGEEEPVPLISEKPSFKVYPNPTTGKFVLEMTGVEATETARIEIYGMQGDKILSKEMINERKHEFSLSDKPLGVYFIRVISGKKAETVKIIKQ